MSKFTPLIEIPQQYQTINQKLEWLKEEGLREQKRDRMDQYYSMQLANTQEYWQTLKSLGKQ